MSFIKASYAEHHIVILKGNHLYSVTHEVFFNGGECFTMRFSRNDSTTYKFHLRIGKQACYIQWTLVIHNKCLRWKTRPGVKV